jgi:hypothetical protein
MPRVDPCMVAAGTHPVRGNGAVCQAGERADLYTVAWPARESGSPPEHAR